MNSQYVFVEYKSIKTPIKVILGDDYVADAIGSGIVAFNSKLPNGAEQCSACA